MTCIQQVDGHDGASLSRQLMNYVCTCVWMQTTLHNWGNTIRSLGSTDPSDDSDNEEGQADGTDSSDSSSGSSKRGQPTVHDEEAQDDLQVCMGESRGC